MAEFSFPGLGLLIDQIRRPDGSFFFRRPNGKSAFQKQHIHPQEDMTGLGRDFVNRISNVDTQYRFNGSDFSINGAALPASEIDSVRVGISKHNGSHPAYTNVVADYRKDVTRRAQLVQDAKYIEFLASNPPDIAE